MSETEDKELRRAWKARTFADYYGMGGGPEARRFPPRVLDVPLSLLPLDREAPLTGRMSVKAPPMRPLPREDGKATWDDVVDAMYENGKLGGEK
ncbi:hypothetical protein [Streptomyces sp. NPDC058252]|uniref:hypothetical protein n=1 Tax=Streptomyces sp. NPDC058252 TaxID=3346405 RepID=UPI0036EE15B4